MKTVMAATIIAALLIPLGVSASAEEGGCLKYGAGAVAGHFAGRHTMSGAAIGCGIGAEKRHRAREEERGQERAYQQGLRDQDNRDGYDYRR
jgi:hypothetical protein